jgi:hypothetical protein
MFNVSKNNLKVTHKHSVTKIIYSSKTQNQYVSIHKFNALFYLVQSK